MKRFVLITLVLGVCWSILATRASSAPSAPTATKADPAALVRQLGDTSYESREEASHQLQQLGRPAIPALQAGVKNPDAEIRRRCSDLLLRVDRPELEPRLAALLEGTDKFTPPMPGWDLFRELTGGDQVARSLYVEMYQADKAWLEQIQRDPKTAATQLQTRAAAVQRRFFVFLPNAKPATEPRLQASELAGLFLAAAADTSNNLQTFYTVVNLVYQPDVQGLIQGNTALRTLVSRFLARRATDQNTFYNVIHLARMFELKDLIEGTLKPGILRKLDESMSQPIDLNKLSQAVNMVASMEMHDQVPARVKKVVQSMAENLTKPPIDQNRFYQTIYLLQSLRMQETLDRVVKPAVFKMAREVGDHGSDVNRFHQVFGLCQSLNIPDATDALKPSACKLVAEAFNSGDQNRVTQAMYLAQSLNLNEAMEGIVKPAVRNQVLAALEQSDDLARLGRVSNLAVLAHLDLVEDTLKPVLRRQAKALLDKSSNLNQVRELHQVAQQLGARDVIDNQVKPALRKALLAASVGTVDQPTLDQSLQLARTLQVKEGAVLAIKGALNRGLPGYTRGNAILFVAVMGTPEQAKQLEPLLSDTTSLGAMNFNNIPTHAEIRDVVLASLVHTSGQKLSDYGYSQFANLGAGGVFTPSPSFFGFPSAAEREKALNQWKKWSAAQKK